MRTHCFQICSKSSVKVGRHLKVVYLLCFLCLFVCVCSVLPPVLVPTNMGPVSPPMHPGGMDDQCEGLPENRVYLPNDPGPLPPPSSSAMFPGEAHSPSPFLPSPSLPLLSLSLSPFTLSLSLPFFLSPLTQVGGQVRRELWQTSHTACRADRALIWVEARLSCQAEPACLAHAERG